MSREELAAWEAPQGLRPAAQFGDDVVYEIDAPAAPGAELPPRG